MNPCQNHSVEQEVLEAAESSPKELLAFITNSPNISVETFESLLNKIYLRVHREAKGEAKIQCLQILEDARRDLTESIGITSIQNRIKSEV